MARSVLRSRTALSAILATLALSTAIGVSWTQFYGLEDQRVVEVPTLDTTMTDTSRAAQVSLFFQRLDGLAPSPQPSPEHLHNRDISRSQETRLYAIGLCVLMLACFGWLIWFRSVRPAVRRWHVGKVTMISLIVPLLAVLLFRIEIDELLVEAVENVNYPTEAILLGSRAGVVLISIATPIAVAWVWFGAREGVS